MINILAEWLSRYRDYLKQQNSAIRMNQMSLTPARTITESLELLPNKCKAVYEKIEEEVRLQSMYEPIFVFIPGDQFTEKTGLQG